MTATPTRPRSMHARTIVVLAMRNLRRQMRRTMLTAAVMVIGGALLIFAFALSDGTHEQWIDSGIRTSTGHVTIEQPEFRTSRRIENRLATDLRRKTEHALASPEIAGQVVAVSSRLSISALASSAAGARPAQILAVDPVAEARFSTLDDQLVEGRYLEPDDRLAAYIGVGLASSLELRLGSRLVVQAEDTEHEIAAQLLRVVGIFRNGVPEVDQAVVHIPLQTAGEWLGSHHDVTNVGVVLTGSTAVAAVTAHLERALVDPIARGDARVMGWREANPALAAAIAIDSFGNYLMFGILFIIIAFGIVNTILMSVLHRHREFGVLQALGLTPGQTGTIVLVEGLTLTAVSGFIGVSLGLLATWYFFGDGLDMSALMGEDMTFSGVVIDPVMVPQFRLVRIAQILTFILCIGAVASIYPALRAAKIDIAESMKFER
ncbi:MAG: ABC transporter permease [Acidobacteria bacterium]|nr:ABC transporter permease [Acidobacteriota bacterium]